MRPVCKLAMVNDGVGTYAPGGVGLWMVKIMRVFCTTLGRCAEGCSMFLLLQQADSR